MPKLALLDEEVGLRNKVADQYSSLLKDVGISTTPVVRAGVISAWAQYTVQVENRDAVQQALQNEGIPTAVHYPIPLNKQPAVRNDAIHLPVGDAIASKVMSLPMHPYLTDVQLSAVAAALAKAINL